MKEKLAKSSSTRATVQSAIDDKQLPKIASKCDIPLNGKISPQNDEPNKNDQQIAVYSKIVQSAKLRAESSQPPRIKRKLKRMKRKNPTNQSKNMGNTSSTDDEICTDPKNRQTATKTPKIRLTHAVSTLVPKPLSTSKRFQCDQCEYATSNRPNFKRHLKTHDVQFQCDKCYKHFHDQDMLELHQTAHKNQCVQCRKRFDSERELDKHMNNCKVQVFQCYLCKFVGGKNHLIKHMERKHW